jgi:EAL domain-containing protein (putative c-di-GMP-specific phosphodiesterase class I)
MQDRSPQNTDSPLRVLLVDDEPDLTRGLKTGLRKTKWAIDTADGGEAALEMLRENGYDVVVSDERMPGMQGSDLLTLVKKEFPATLRITLSGQASLERAVHAINAAEIHRYLLKPCPPSEVQATIEELLEKRDELDDLSTARAADEAREFEALTGIFEEAMDQMWMSYQPIWTGESEIYGYEALLRTDSEAVLGPQHFFEMAESLDRSLELGRVIRDMVGEEISRAATCAKIFVNVNPDHLADESLYGSSAPLSKHADRVVIEITERSALSSDDDLVASLARLSDLGFDIAVDDLGAGYSGLNTFSMLSPAIVKLDMEMIRNIDRAPTKQAVVGAMAELCKWLEIKSIAEGIETEAEYLTAKSLGCSLFQGYLLGEPERGLSHDVDRWDGVGPGKSAA